MEAVDGKPIDRAACLAVADPVAAHRQRVEILARRGLSQAVVDHVGAAAGRGVVHCGSEAVVTADDDGVAARGARGAGLGIESLGPVRSYEPKARDGGQHVRELFKQTFPRFKEFEPHMRAALQLSLEHESLERVGLLEEPRYRRGFRRGLLHRAAAPLRQQLGRRRYDKLMKALSIVYGIEPYVVLKDIWGSADREVEEIAGWVVDAMIDAALREAG